MRQRRTYKIPKGFLQNSYKSLQDINYLKVHIEKWRQKNFFKTELNFIVDNSYHIFFEYF